MKQILTIIFLISSITSFAQNRGTIKVQGNGSSVDSSFLNGKLAEKLNISDTAAMLAPYATTGKLNISDTATMLSPYVRALKLKSDSSTLATAINGKANINSPAFTGTPTSSTPAITDSSNKIATTAYINNGLRMTGIDVTLFANNLPVFRGVRASTAWSDGADAQWFQIGASDDKVVFTTKQGRAAERTMFLGSKFQLSPVRLIPAPTDNFEIFSNAGSKIFSVSNTGNVTAGNLYSKTQVDSARNKSRDSVTTAVAATYLQKSDSTIANRVTANSTVIAGKADTSNITQTADYVIEKVGSTIYARPGFKSGLSAYSGSDAYTVIQAAITALTPAGSVGTGGGKIHIKRGTYVLTNELTIVGWEGVFPYSQLIIEGEGNSTWLEQTTSGKNGLVIKNMPSIKLTDLKISAETGARSAILLESDGTLPCSMYKSYWNNLTLIGTSTTYPALYMKNFMNIQVGLLIAQNVNGTAIIWENNSSTILYGNSTFGQIKTTAGTNSGDAGLLIKSTSATKMMNLISVQHFECLTGDYGIRTDYASNISFNFIDIENVDHPISLGTFGAGSANDTYAVSFNGGYILPNSGAISIECPGVGNGANNFKNIFIDGDATSTPISDGWPSMGNSYDVILGYNVVPGNIDAASPNTSLKYRSMADGTTHERLAANTVIKDNPITGTAAPTSTPAFIGQEFLDTTNKKLYKAFGTSSSADWIIVN